MPNNRALILFIFATFALYGLFLAAPVPLLRTGALWALVVVAMVGSLLLSWRDLA